MTTVPKAAVVAAVSEAAGSQDSVDNGVEAGTGPHRLAVREIAGRFRVT